MKAAPFFIALFVALMSCSDSDDDSVVVDPPVESEIYFPPLNGDEWMTADPDTLEWNVNAISDLYNFLEENETRAFIVLKDGKIVLEQYFGKDLLGRDFDKKSYWYWASAGKSLVGFLGGLARESGLLDMDQPSFDYLGPDWAAISTSQQEAIKVHHHFSMTTGLDDGTGDADCTDPECLTYLIAPGTRWAYHNAAYTLTHSIIENAVGIPFQNYFNSELRDRTGMDGQWIYLDNNHVYSSTARSMARFGMLVLNEGEWDGDRLMEDSEYFDEMITSSQTYNPSYGYLWWLNGQTSYIIPGTQISISQMMSPSAPAHMWVAAGKNGQLLNIVPDENLVVVRMGDSNGNAFVSLSLQEEMWQYLNRVLL